MMNVRNCDESTINDAKVIVKTRWGTAGEALLERLLHNPVRSCESIGDISYKENHPMAFQAAILKRLFIKQQEILGVSGAMYCKMPGAPLRYVLAVSEWTSLSKSGCKIAFGNTAMPVSTEIALASASSLGPDSCANIRFAIIRLGSFIDFVMQRKIPRRIIQVLDWIWLNMTRVFCGKEISNVQRIMSIDEVDVDRFWGRYLASNKGLVCSRTKDELRWTFEDEIRRGRVHFLAFLKNSEMLGYVAIKRKGQEGVCRWMVVDWIAIEDDPTILKTLLMGVKSYLRSMDGAAFVEMIGYPTSVQRVIQKVFPYKRKASGNSFSYRIYDDGLRKAFEHVKDYSWFFGSYDGDRCL